MGPSPHLWFLHAKQHLLDEHTSLYMFQTSHVVLCMQTACLVSELLVSMGPRLYLCFCACKTASFGPAYKSLLVPDLTCRFVHAKQRD